MKVRGTLLAAPPPPCAALLMVMPVTATLVTVFVMPLDTVKPPPPDVELLVGATIPWMWPGSVRVLAWV